MAQPELWGHVASAADRCTSWHIWRTTLSSVHTRLPFQRNCDAVGPLARNHGPVRLGGASSARGWSAGVPSRDSGDPGPSRHSFHSWGATLGEAAWQIQMHHRARGVMVSPSCPPFRGPSA